MRDLHLKLDIPKMHKYVPYQWPIFSIGQSDIRLINRTYVPLTKSYGWPLVRISGQYWSLVRIRVANVWRPAENAHSTHYLAGSFAYINTPLDAQNHLQIGTEAPKFRGKLGIES